MVDADPSAVPHKRPWAVTFFCLLSIGGLVAMPILAGKPGVAEMPDIVRFLGRFHPVVLHLPIGVFSLILFQELGAIFGRRRRVEVRSPLFPLFFGTASAILAVIAGFLLYHGHGEDYRGNELVERHLWGGLVFAVAAVLTFLLKAWALALDANRAWYRLLLFGSVGVMGFASHDGASITHGRDYLTRYAPASTRGFLGLDARDKPIGAAKEEDQVVYADIIAPIFERRCVQCHKEGKAKGKFRMDTYEQLVKGGKEGPGIVPGNSAESNIMVRIDLPEDDDEHMPPEGKPDIEEAGVRVLRWWLDSGADPKKKLAEFEVPAEVQEALGKLSGTAPAGEETSTGQSEPVKSSGPDTALKSAVAGLSEQFPGALAFESKDSPWLTFSAVSLRGKLDDQAFGRLGPVLPQLVSVDLSATRITDQAVVALEAAKQLRLLRLAETGITDAAIDSLLKMPALESINFYGTKVTDAGVQKLAAMPNLKRLYLWQTAVTPNGVKAIKDKLPHCEIVEAAMFVAPR